MDRLTVEAGKQSSEENQWFHTHNVRHASSHRARLRSLKLAQEYDLFDSWSEAPSPAELLVYEKMAEGFLPSENSNLVVPAGEYYPNYAALCMQPKQAEPPHHGLRAIGKGVYGYFERFQGFRGFSPSQLQDVQAFLMSTAGEYSCADTRNEAEQTG